MTPEVMRRTGLAVLTAAALFGAAQMAALPLRVAAQTPPDASTASGTLSASGIGQVPGDTAEAAGGALMMSIEERTANTDVLAAVKRAQARLATLRAALVAAGVPDSAIHVQGFNIGPSYGYPYPIPAVDPAAGGAGAAGSAEGGVAPPSMAARPVPPPPPSGYIVNAQLMAETSGPEQLASAMRVAIESGATNVNSFIKGGPGNPTPPDSARLAPAIQQATAQAKVMAQASAEAAGVTLGGIDRVSVLPPTPSFGGGPGPIPSVTWQVQVKVTYHIQ